MWYFISGFVSIVVCMSLLFIEYFVVIFVLCFFSVVFVGYCYGVYKLFVEIFKRFRVLQNNIWEMCREVVKYCINLEIMKMRIDLDCFFLFNDNLQKCF